MAIVAKFTRTLPAPTATISGGFVFLLSAGWFTQASTGAAGSPIDGGTNSLASGGGDMQIFSDTGATTRLPIEVVSFVTGGSSSAQIWVRVQGYTTGDTITIGKDDTQTVQPIVTAAFGRNAVWSGFLAVLHLNETPTGSITDFIDSTGSGRNGQGLNGLNSTSVGHPFGGTWADFDGFNDYINIANTSGFLDGIDFTISAWGINEKNLSATDVSFISNRQSGGGAGKVSMSVDDGGVAAAVDDNYSKGSSGLESTLIRRSLINDQTNWWSRINGDANVTNVSGPIIAPDTLWIGRYFDDNASRRWEGKIGEIWVRPTAISFDKDKAEYANQSDPDNFGTSSEYVLVAGGGVTVTGTTPSFNYSSIAASIDLTGSIDITGQTANYTYSVVNGAVDLTGDISITGATASYNYQSINGVVDLTGEITVLGLTPNQSYSSVNGIIELGAVISVVGLTPNYSYQGIIGEVSLNGEILVSGETPSYSYSAIKGFVTTGEEQVIGTVTSSFASDVYSSGFKPNTITVNFKS